LKSALVGPSLKIVLKKRIKTLIIEHGSSEYFSLSLQSIHGLARILNGDMNI